MKPNSIQGVWNDRLQAKLATIDWLPPHTLSIESYINNHQHNIVAHWNEWLMLVVLAHPDTRHTQRYSSRYSILPSRCEYP